MAKDEVLKNPDTATALLPWEQDSRVAAVVQDLIDEATSADLSMGILHHILDAEDVHQMVPGTDLLSIKDLCKRDKDLYSPALFIRGFRPNLSDFEGEGLPVYLVFDAVDVATGEYVAVGTGSLQTVVSFYAMRAKDKLPVVVRWRISPKETKSGYRPLNMEIIDADPLGRNVNKIDPPQLPEPAASDWVRAEP